MHLYHLASVRSLLWFSDSLFEARDTCCEGVRMSGIAIIAVVLLFLTAIAVTFYLTRESTRARLTAEYRKQVCRSIECIFDNINAQLQKALLATGTAKTSEAHALLAAIRANLGPMLIFVGSLGPVVRQLETAVSGKQPQDRVCDCCVCDPCTEERAGDCRGAGGTIIHTTGGPSASAAAAAAGGAAAAAAAAAQGQTIIVNTHRGPHGGRNGAPAGHRIHCHCGRGTLSDAAPCPPPVAHRPMTTDEQADASRKAIEAFAQIWHKKSVTEQLCAIYRMLAETKCLKAPKPHSH